MMQRQKVIFLKYHINTIEFDKSNSYSQLVENNNLKNVGI